MNKTKKILIFLLLTAALLCALSLGALAEDAADEVTDFTLPSDAVKYDGRYYKVFDNVELDWQSAQNYCESLHGHLLTVTTEDEQKFVENLLKGHSKNFYWMGGYESEEGWKWVTDEEFDYTNWEYGQPDDGMGGEDYLMMYNRANFDNALYTWNDMRNDGIYPGESFWGLSNSAVICEWDYKPADSYTVELDYSSITLAPGVKQEIKATVKNESGAPTSEKSPIRWYSADESIATVTGEGFGDTDKEYAVGEIIAIAEGVTEIHAEIENKQVATCTVIVSESGVISPLKISTEYEFISHVISSSNENATEYEYAPRYKIKATVTNDSSADANGVTVKLILPNNAKVYGDYDSDISVSRIQPGESASFTWEIIADVDPNATTAIQYSIAAKSINSAESREYKTIFIDPFVIADNTIDFKNDVWNFTNDSKYFNKGHFINTKYYNALVGAIENIEKERIDDLLNSDWFGSCFGMSTIVSLMKIGRLNPEDYKSSADSLKELPSPKNDEEIYSLITYYHMMQKLDSYYSAYIANFIDDGKELTESERTKRLVSAVEKVKTGGAPILFGIWYKSEQNKDLAGHSLVAYDVEYVNKSVKNLTDDEVNIYDKRILIYDPNEKNPIYLYINADCTKWLLEGYCQNDKDSDSQYDIGEGYFIFVDDEDVLDPINASDSIKNYYSNLITSNQTKLLVRVTRKDGATEEFISDGANIFSASKYGVIPYIDELNGDGTASSFGYLFTDEIKDVNISAADGVSPIDLTYTANGISYRITSENGGEVFISEDTILTLECNGEYSLTAIYNEGEYSSAWYYYSIDGSAFGAVSISQNEEGYLIIDSDELSDIDLTVKSHSATERKTFSTEEDSVMISNQGSAVTVLTDTDNDGSYDSVLTDAGDKSDNDSEVKKGNGSQIYVTAILIASVALLAIAGVTVAIIIAVKKKANASQKD